MRSIVRGGPPDERDVPVLPCVEERDEVVGVPGPEEASLPVVPDEVLERGTGAPEQVAMLAEPLKRAG